MTEAFEWSGSNKISEKMEVISYEWDSELNNLARKERDKRMKIREEKIIYLQNLKIQTICGFLYVLHWGTESVCYPVSHSLR